VYTLPHADLLRLDAFEGHPRHYSRRLLAAVGPDGTPSAVWVYVATPEYRRNGLLPRREHLARLIAGADLLSAAYRAQLAAVRTFD
jgi:gamma-glutamylcyclotransferase (GGCT)/AIG2-like uncharacterized protein YtfP